MLDYSHILPLLQLASSALPVGAYSYSEGWESLVETGKIADAAAALAWLTQDLQYGAIRLDAAVLVRCYRAIATDSLPDLVAWNAWLSATRDSEELRSQSWQMGRSLLRLWQDLQLPDAPPPTVSAAVLSQLQQDGCNFACTFAIVAHHWGIDLQAAVLGYLYGWASNLVSAGIKLIPLGQTAGQALLVQLRPELERATAHILSLGDADLEGCGWGLAIASMTHETQYSRLFRS